MESVLKSRLGMFLCRLGIAAFREQQSPMKSRTGTRTRILWAAPGGDTELTRHSRLKDINATNVHKLQMIWSQSAARCAAMKASPWW